MGRVRIAFPMFVNSLVLFALAALMLVPASLDALSGNMEDAAKFLISAALTGFVATYMFLLFRVDRFEPVDRRAVYLLTASAWILVSLFGAVPLFLTVPGISVTNALFESTSGLTTTGATVLAGLDNMPIGVLMWRSLLQWIGGIGIIVMAIVVLPRMNAAGMQFFKSESSDISDSVFASVRQLARAIATVYLSLTFACAVALSFAGMSVFDAVNHAMTTIATGGFSTKDASIGYYNSLPIEIVIEVFMISGALPLAFYSMMLVRRSRKLIGDTQVLTFLKVVAVFVLALTAWNYLHGMRIGEALRLAAFNIISIVTDTGFATADFSTWGSFAVGLFFMAYLVGGCAGSTAGAIKIFRWQILFSGLFTGFRKMVTPNAVLISRYNGKVVDDASMSSIRNFFFLYIITLFSLSLVVMATGVDFLSATSSIAQAMANAGPGLGPLVGPATNFDALPELAKWTVMVGMLLGRLELVTFYLVVMPFFWVE